MGGDAIFESVTARRNCRTSLLVLHRLDLVLGYDESTPRAKNLLFQLRESSLHTGGETLGALGTSQPSIDGIGDKTAALLLAELGDPLRFAGSRALTAFAGLNPQLQESGVYRGQARISRTGSSRLRAGLYMPAVCSLKRNPAISALRDRLKAKGKSGKQIVCAAMRKLLSIAYGVLKSGQPFDPRLAIAH